MAKIGRPKKLDAKRKVVQFRLKDNQVKMLDNITEKTGLNKTDVFVELITREHSRINEEVHK